jgi:hypothetical protein
MVHVQISLRRALRLSLKSFGSLQSLLTAALEIKAAFALKHRFSRQVFCRNPGRVHRG